MFTDLRKKSGSLIVYLMFAAIIITFVISFGPGDQGCRAQPNWVAMVGGDVITQAEFRFLYNNYYDFYQRMIPEFNAQKAQEMNIAKLALDSLVDVVLLAQKAEKLGFAVTDDEIRKEITETPYFQQGGSFNRDQYNRFVQFQMGMPVAAYVETVRRDLLAKRLRAFLSDSADISEDEMKEEFINTNESLDAQLFVFGKSRMKPEAVERLRQAVNEGELKDFLAKEEKRARSFYEDNKARWTKDDKTVKPFEEVNAEIARELLLDDRIAALAKADAAKTYSLLSNPSYKSENLKKDLPDWDMTPLAQNGIRKNQPYIPDLGVAPSLVKTLFLSVGLTAISQPAPIEVDDKVVVARILKHTPADMAKFETEKETIRRSLLSAKAREIVESYLKTVRQKTTVELNEQWLAVFRKTGGE